MKSKIIITFILFFTCTWFSEAQNHHQHFTSIDVQHYAFEIHLNDSTDCIEGKTHLSVNILKPIKSLVLDLQNTNEEQKGMFVKSVNRNGKTAKFSHKNNQLIIPLHKQVDVGDMVNFEVQYSGVPIDGLVISKNEHDERTFFGDNWPNRAKHWLPCVDHPSDKATLEFKVYAPEHYEVVSNGYLVNKKLLGENMEFTHWITDIPISTKLMVIGVANFAVGNKTKSNSVPVSSWVFEENKEQGLKSYKYGTEALEYFSELIGTYSYEKLAHVQSKTRYGGMENASCIFYHERTATSNRSQERLFAHEVAHQWFGNSVTEQNWHHLWLSEGFATYLTHVYNQHFYGEETFREGLKNDRERVIRYARRNAAPIIDTTVNDYIRLLNTNSYQKASWFLHMLRIQLGDEVFFQGLRKYYADFQNSTALTNDFKNIMETVSGKDLDTFFEQWLWQAGHPVLDFSWSTNNNEDSGELHICVAQQTPLRYSFPLEIELNYEDGSSELKTLKIDKEQQEQGFKFKTSSKIKTINPDPHTKLLFEIFGEKH